MPCGECDVEKRSDGAAADATGRAQRATDRRRRPYCELSERTVGAVARFINTGVCIAPTETFGHPNLQGGGGGTLTLALSQ